MANVLRDLCRLATPQGPAVVAIRYDDASTSPPNLVNQARVTNPSTVGVYVRLRHKPSGREFARVVGNTDAEPQGRLTVAVPAILGISADHLNKGPASTFSCDCAWPAPEA